ncbi:hypothetical protein [Streptomyces rubradiris]|uniref:hypothetical protein n=1 Tax=Streptomyces rubradiris TaxID=285531 RepID=UPI0019425710|nr:hypothetical protein [Streptomyces rubradiris]
MHGNAPTTRQGPLHAEVVVLADARSIFQRTRMLYALQLCVFIVVQKALSVFDFLLRSRWYL